MQSATAKRIPTQQVGDSKVTTEPLPWSALAVERKRQVPPRKQNKIFLFLDMSSKKPERIGTRNIPKYDFKLTLCVKVFLCVFKMLYKEQY